MSREIWTSRAASTLDRRQLLKIFGTVAAAGATSGLLAACTDDSADSGPTGTIRVGLVVPTSGPFAGIGQDLQRGFELFLSNNDNLLGNYSVDLHVVDEGTTPESAVAAMNLLINQSVVAIAGVVNPDALPSAVVAASSYQTPLVTCHAAPKTLTNAVWVWRVGAQQGEAGQALAIQALRRGKPTYVVYDATSTGRAEFESFVGGFAGGSLVQSQEEFESGAAVGVDNIEARLADAVGRGAQTIVAAFSGDEALAVLKAYRGLATPELTLLGTGSLTETVDLAALGTLPKEVHTAMYYAPDLDNESNRRFVTDYHRAHAVQPTAYAMAGYDGAAVLHRGFAQLSGDPKGLDLNSALGRLGQIQSPRGNWTFNANRTPQQKWYLRKLDVDGQVTSNLLEADLAVLG